MTQPDSKIKPLSERRSVKNIIIHRPMQREFTLIAIALMMISAVMVNFLIQYTLNEVISNNISGFGRVGGYNILSDVSFDLIVRVTLVMFVTILTVALFGIFFLHRVAGPVYRFHQIFLQMSRRGEIPQDVALRQKDFFKDTATELNSVFKTLRQRRSVIRQAEEQMEALSRIQNPAEIQQRIKEIQKILREASL
ncbi:MAG: hypothetical protein COV74_05055 [Candidatus Omnitrophica bacterium CG11_big_fil_rev_8_21_14_0_20_45_26]|uniref:HAMP domain-containing protein n=1 Tax=Candidatus Abzuiibacterium crystallinum TaxID=1974748 RepID=A0A2H0LS89_9BACT|nr:MAG: hypothetical protein COV74_05055 [Candidatus Omnitrophica bacterium CG11_big_fil_rev_8_21_14_0_20_45_26]PIW64363.1 MAG: hypothetical protein COW12_06505 [Candidatus Omnitrophica bacterium CG12_big_fil_rev_8_21_14_0_65_45_16]